MSSHWEEYAEIQANEKASQPQREPTHLFVTDWGRIDYCAKCGRHYIGHDEAEPSAEGQSPYDTMNLPTEYEPMLDPESNFNRSAMRDWYAAKAEGQALELKAEFIRDFVSLKVSWPNAAEIYWQQLRHAQQQAEIATDQWRENRDHADALEAENEALRQQVAELEARLESRPESP